jgi:UDP-N-acetylmuramoylalanine--D-glutamate ligase
MIDLPTYASRTVAVLGLARTGAAAVRALHAAGANVIAWDDNENRRNEHAGAGVQLTNLNQCHFDNVDALVLSPGVPFTHPEPHVTVKNAQAAGVPVIGDVELFVTSNPVANVVGITGTNGKSTTTALLGYLLEAAGHPVEVGGNIGRPVLDFPPMPNDGTYVVELSSYQIDLAPSLVCDVAVLINISRDHLDRHGDMAGYVAIKRRIFMGQHGASAAVIGVDDDHSRATYEWLKDQGHANLIPIAVGQSLDHGVCVINGVLHDRIAKTDDTVALDGIKTLRGAHNWQNVAAAYAAARCLGLTRDQITDALPGFPGLAHRAESLAVIAGVEYVNDSKATNAEAAARALATFDEIYWIAGGRAKEGGYAAFDPFLNHVRHAYLIGEAAPELAVALADKIETTRSDTLGSAVAAATVAAQSAGGHPVVLLSPACASFDQYPNFAARGDAFRALVAGLAPNGGMA